MAPIIPPSLPAEQHIYGIVGTERPATTKGTTMRITESGLRRIIRQEVRSLREAPRRQWAQGPAPSPRTLRARLKALLGPASDRYELDAVYDFVWDIIQELRDPDPAGPHGGSEILRMFESELIRLLESNEQSGRSPGEIRETAKNIVAEFGPV